MNNFEEYDKLTFEEAMKALEEIVRKLDSGDSSLDESILLFQRGVYLSKLCSARLEDIEKRVAILTGSKENPLEEGSAALPLEQMQRE